MSKRSGNPAKRGWDPILVLPAPDPGNDFGVAGHYYRYAGQKHWYSYREKQPATDCRVFRNRLYNGWALTFQDGSMHLTFKRNDRAAISDWRHMQAIKNEVAGPEREAVAIYPPESLLIDGANEYHLWVLPENLLCPAGLDYRAVMEPHDIPDDVKHDHSDYRLTGRSGTVQRGWEPGLPTGPGLANGDKNTGDLVPSDTRKPTKGNPCHKS